MEYRDLKDEQLVALLRDADEHAFEEIYQRYWKNVFRYAITRVHEQAVAEDLCHDIFLSLWHRRGVVQIRQLEAWLIQSVKYSIINHLKGKLTDRKHAQGLWLSNEKADRQTEYTIAFNSLYQAWQEAIKKLPDQSKEIFRLSKIQHRTNKEIAFQLKLSEKAVEYHITKALKFLRMHLRDFDTLLLILLACNLQLHY